MNIQARRSSTCAPSPCAAAAPTTTIRADGHWIDDHIATPMARYPEYRQSRRSLRHQRARHAGRRDRSERRHDRLRGHHGRRARRVHRREAPGALPRGPAHHRHREDLGPDVLRDPVLWPQGHRGERDLRRRPGALGPARQARGGAGACAARRPGARRAGLLRHRRASRPREGDGLHRRQDAAAARARRRARRACREYRRARRHARARSATTSG